MFSPSRMSKSESIEQSVNSLTGLISHVQAVQCTFIALYDSPEQSPEEYGVAL